MRCLSLILSLLLVLQPFERLVLQSKEVNLPIGSTVITAGSIAISSTSGADVRVVSDASSLTLKLAEPAQLSLSAEGSLAGSQMAASEFIASMTASVDLAIGKSCKSSSDTCKAPHYNVTACHAVIHLNVSVAGMNLLTNFKQDLCPEIREGVALMRLPRMPEKDASEAPAPGSQSDVLPAPESTRMMSTVFWPAFIITDGLRTEAHRSASGQSNLLFSAEKSCAEMRLSYPNNDPASAPQRASSYVKSVNLNLTLPEEGTVSIDVSKDNVVSAVTVRGLGFEGDALMRMAEPFLNTGLALLRENHREGASLETLGDTLMQWLSVGKAGAPQNDRSEDDL